MAWIILQSRLDLLYHTPMDRTALHAAIAKVPPGRWAVGVSGGADSTALLLLLHERTDLSLHVAHLDHETRAGESAVDAEFVRQLAKGLSLHCTIERRSTIEAGLTKILSNPSARYRAARLKLFRGVVDTRDLNGVLLAHHADDQAETILMRLLRGSALENLGGIQPESVVGGLRIVRPLLEISARSLRDCLIHRGQSWREDASNQSVDYQRNRLRLWLKDRPELANILMRVGQGSNSLHRWLNQHAPTLACSFSVKDLHDVSIPLARHAVISWLKRIGVPPKEINPSVCDRLLEMVNDAGSPPARHFPGKILVRRRADYIFAETPVD